MMATSIEERLETVVRMLEQANREIVEAVTKVREVQEATGDEQPK